MIRRRFYRMTPDGEMTAGSDSLEAIERLRAHHAAQGYVSRYSLTVEITPCDWRNEVDENGDIRPFRAGDVIGQIRLVS